MPVFHIGLPFCCAGCAADGPCMCTYDPPGAAAARGRATRTPLSVEEPDVPDEPDLPAIPPLRPERATASGSADGSARASRPVPSEALTSH